MAFERCKTKSAPFETVAANPLPFYSRSHRKMLSL
nr:MAG TPA: hypothetical protein [Caudoviricetes sp.]